MTQHQNNRLSIRYLALIIGLGLNALGNGITIASNTGSAVYTAASVDLFKLTGWLSISYFIFGWGLLNDVINMFLLKKMEWWRFIKGLIYITFFSYFVDVFSKIAVWLGLSAQGFWFRTLFSLIGTILIGISISIYQRANLFLHPNDDMTNILRFDYFKGSAVWAQFVDLLLPVSAILWSWLVLGHLYAVSIATVCYFLFNGLVIKYTDRWIWPSLKHNF